MDMTPPQAPPAITQDARQEVVDAADRLGHFQAWLGEQQAAMPALPTTDTPDGLATFQRELSAFWLAPLIPGPGLPAAPRMEVLADRLASAMVDDATLLWLDGTLDETAHTVATALSHARQLPEGLHAHELMFGNVPYAGALVLTADTLGERALLFLGDRGWKTYPNLDALHADVESMARREVAAGDAGRLPGVTSEYLMRLLDYPFVSSREFDGDVFLRLALGIATMQQEQADAAWTAYRQATARGTDGSVPNEATVPGYRIDQQLDMAGVLLWRNAALYDSVSARRLADVPEDVRVAWHAAMEAHAAATADAERTRADAGLVPIEAFDDFIADALTGRLRKAGVTSDPHDIVVEFHANHPSFNETAGMAQVISTGNERVGGRAADALDRVSLVELARRNIGALDMELLKAVDRDGKDLWPALTSRSIKQMVRELDVARRYHDYLRDALLSSPEGQLRRTLATSLLRKRMHAEAIGARLGYYLADEPVSFLRQPAQAGYRRVQAAIDAPDPRNRARVDGERVVVSHLTYEGHPVKDVLAISGAGSSVVLYTPGTDDGVVFREFPDRASAARGFLLNPAFSSYLVERLPLNLSEVRGQGAPRLKADWAARRLQWTLNIEDRYLRPAGRFDEREITGNFLEASYDAGVATLTANLQANSRRAAHADADHLPLDVAGKGDAMLRAVSRFIGRPFVAAWSSYDAAKAGNYEQAFLDFTQAYVASLDYLGAPFMAPSLGRMLPVRAGPASTRLVRNARPMRDASATFDRRYVATVRPGDAEATAHGVHTIAGKTYIRHQGEMYGVRLDADMGLWRLTREGAPDWRGPLVERGPNGAWTYARAGLRGGMDESRRHLGISMFRGQGGLEPHQMSSAYARLRQSLTEAEAEWVGRRVRAGRIAALPPSQRRAWEDALEVGRNARVPTEPAPPPILSGATRPEAAAGSATQAGAAPATVEGLWTAEHIRQFCENAAETFRRLELTTGQRRAVLDRLYRNVVPADAIAIGQALRAGTELAQVQALQWHHALAAARLEMPMPRLSLPTQIVRPIRAPAPDMRPQPPLIPRTVEELFDRPPQWESVIRPVPPRTIAPPAPRPERTLREILAEQQRNLRAVPGQPAHVVRGTQLAPEEWPDLLWVGGLRSDRIGFTRPQRVLGGAAHPGVMMLDRPPGNSVTGMTSINLRALRSQADRGQHGGIMVTRVEHAGRTYYVLASRWDLDLRLPSDYCQFHSYY